MNKTRLFRTLLLSFPLLSITAYAYAQFEQDSVEVLELPSLVSDSPDNSQEPPLTPSPENISAFPVISEPTQPLGKLPEILPLEDTPPTTLPKAVVAEPVIALPPVPEPPKASIDTQTGAPSDPFFSLDEFQKAQEEETTTPIKPLITDAASISSPPEETKTNTAASNSAQNTQASQKAFSDMTGKWQSGSIMFTKDESYRLKESIYRFQTRQPIIEENKPSDTAEISPTESNEDDFPRTASAAAPTNFFLNSIMYMGQDNWSIWLNSTKISDKNPNALPEIEILSVSRNEVVLKWTPASQYTPIAQPSAGVIDHNNGSYEFTLSTNQALLVSKLEIVEGPPFIASINTESSNGNTSSSVAAAIAGRNQDEENNMNRLIDQYRQGGQALGMGNNFGQ
jgi:hypothetical protein